jgi:chemotaxis response regulator CheB
LSFSVHYHKKNPVVMSETVQTSCVCQRTKGYNGLLADRRAISATVATGPDVNAAEQQGVIAEDVQNPTLSDPKEGRGGSAKWSECVLIAPKRRPDIIASQADVFPAEGSNMGQQVVKQRGRSQHRPNIAFDVVAVVASPGGPKALNCILAGLPTDFTASVLVVQRLCLDQQPRLLADILSRHTALMVTQTVKEDLLRPANVFTSVSDRHLQIRPDGTVSQAPRVQFVRPLYDFASPCGHWRGRWESGEPC